MEELHVEYSPTSINNDGTHLTGSNLFSSQGKRLRKSIIIGQSAMVFCLIFIIFWLILKSSNIHHQTSSQHLTGQWVNYIDNVIARNIDFIRLNQSNNRILFGWHLKLLDELRLNEMNNCYSIDELSLYYHYCKDQSNYPILFDGNCFPHSVDLYEKLLSKNSSEFPETDLNFVKNFLQFYHEFLANSSGIMNQRQYEIRIAFEYSRKIGRDCEHQSVWADNFNLSYASGRNEHELYELYCQRMVQYPNLISMNSGKYYVPGYYLERIQQTQLPIDEQWMYQWMKQKFIPLYQQNTILQQRFQHELNISKQYAIKNRLNCPRS